MRRTATRTERTRRPPPGRRTRQGANGEGSPSSLALAATSMIRDRILDLTLRPGLQLDETVLREQLGISRTPAREALNRLATEGLVETRANRGFHVRPLDLGDTARFFDAYLVAERSAAYFCRFSHPGLVADLEAIQALHSAAVARRAFLDVSKENASFHIRIVTATENPHLVDFSSRLHNLARRLAYFVYDAESEQGEQLDEQQRHIVREHLAIIDAVRAGDRAALLEGLTSHARRFQVRISRFVAGDDRRLFGLPAPGA